ncbi:R3H-associated N-terminal domain-containing protein [Calycina marina]|uniref:R3H-associated N-terminal domain-containing protein n=1 Tax=Calycina marina TaxID=1763456 RepID=A0A9P8CFF6_9HELO|nr:R3H-associated N-terminal domain-containing protein [Calycina marina]
MAIFSAVPPPEQVSLAIEVTPGVTLQIPIDTPTKRADGYKAIKEPLRRDSMKRRDALLKGKEGSRRRQRWENDRLLHVPNAQPPLPCDWAPMPLYPVHTVPYYLAPLWESGIKAVAEEARNKKTARAGVSEQKGRVPQELRQKLKKSKGAKTLLQELEEEVRRFVRQWELELSGEKENNREEEESDEEYEKVLFVGRGRGDSVSSAGEVDSEDETIVFVGRNGGMSDEQRKTVEKGLEKEKLVFDSLADDTGASFGRWLVHSIAAYYGLTSRSITVGDPARREAYVGIKQMKSGRSTSDFHSELPRPLWGMI